MAQPSVSIPLRRRVVQWVDGQAWLKALYRYVPSSLRDRLADRLKAPLEPIYCRFENEAGWDARRRSVPDAPVHFFGEPEATWEGHGANLFAYLRGQFGLAESARLYARALLGARYPTALIDIDLDLPHAWDDRSLDDYIGEAAPHRVHLVFINPDYLDAALDQIGQARLKGGYIIACWFWELENIPDTWLPALEKVDEILVASRYVGEAFARATQKPILCVPLPLSEVGDSGLQRRDFDIRDDAFVFLTSFDFSSYLHRKNPLAVIRAFRLAFPPERQDVQLLVKTSNGFRTPELLQEVLEACGADPRIVVRDQVLDRTDVHALQRCADVYVSLHRAEGFGLGLAECMAQGKPVIATAWSGNMEFMDTENSALVNYSLIPVGPGEYAHSQGQRWADADVNEAAGWMQRFANDPASARAMGERARRSVTEMLSAEHAAAALIRRIEDVHHLHHFSSHVPADNTHKTPGGQ